MGEYHSAEHLSGQLSRRFITQSFFLQYFLRANHNTAGSILSSENLYKNPKNYVCKANDIVYLLGLSVKTHGLTLIWPALAITSVTAVLLMYLWLRRSYSESVDYKHYKLLLLIGNVLWIGRNIFSNTCTISSFFSRN